MGCTIGVGLTLAVIAAADVQSLQGGVLAGSPDAAMFNVDFGNGSSARETEVQADKAAKQPKVIATKCGIFMGFIDAKFKCFRPES
jgi:hypothetical protein